MPRIIAFANQKGGVGKTTSAINVAAALAVSERRTLLIDLDPQSNATAGLSEIVRNGAPRATIYDVLINGTPALEAVASTELPFLHVIGSTRDLVAAEVELVGRTAREHALNDAVIPISNGYEFVLIDCPPSLGLLTLNALAMAQTVLIPIQCEYFALKGLGQLLQTIGLVQRHLNTGLKVEGILVTMYDGRLNLSRKVEEEVRGHCTDRVFRTIIRRNVRLGEAPGFGKPILLYDANSAGAQDYWSLTREILENGDTAAR